MLAPGLVVWAKFVTVPDDATVVEALGQQWSWSFRLPGQRRRAGRHRCLARRPGQPVRHGPERSARPGRRAGRQPGAAPAARQAGQGAAALEGRAAQLHGAAVPREDGPGARAWSRTCGSRRRGPATYEILCEELCGLGHFAMRGRVVVDERRTPTQRGSPTQPTYAADRGASGGRRRRGPGRVRGVRGLPWRRRRRQPVAERAEARRPARLVPDAAAAAISSTGFAAARRATRSPARWRRSRCRSTRRPSTTSSPTSRRCRTTAPHATIKGDAARGASRYTTCAYCHGAAGQGSWSTNAPRLAGMSDWYLARQLQQFRQGHRGRHPQDFHGAQMATIEPASWPTARPPTTCWPTSTPCAERSATQCRPRREPDVLRRDRGPARAPARPADVHHQVRLEPGPQGHRHPVHGDGDGHRARGDRRCPC